MHAHDASRSRDPLTRMRLHALARAAGDDGWLDAARLISHPVTRPIADQLYRTLGSIAANIAEGYSRASVKDRMRFYEYALGSVREAGEWYQRGRFVLGAQQTSRRTTRLEEIARILMAMVRRARNAEGARFDV
jgi:four helix bundle protein